MCNCILTPTAFSFERELPELGVKINVKSIILVAQFYSNLYQSRCNLGRELCSRNILHGFFKIFYLISPETRDLLGYYCRAFIVCNIMLLTLNHSSSGDDTIKSKFVSVVIPQRKW